MADELGTSLQAGAPPSTRESERPEGETEGFREKPGAISLQQRELTGMSDMPRFSQNRGSTLPSTA